MGNKQKSRVEPPSMQQVTQSFQFIGKHQGQQFELQQILAPIKTIIHCLQTSQPIQKQPTTNNIYIHPCFLRFVFSQYFINQVNKVLQILLVKLEQLSSRNLTFVNVDEITNLNFIADFVLYFSNQKILENFDTLLVRTDVSEENKKQLKQLQKLAGGELEVNGNIVQKFNKEQMDKIQKFLRVTMVNFINLRLKSLSRSDATLRQFAYFEQSLFLLYCKLYFAHHASGRNQPNIPQLIQHFKSNLTIGAYFLAMGTSYMHPSLFQASVIFLYSFLKLNIQHKQIKSLPSHIFKNLPIIATHSMYQYILCNILFTLKYVKQNNKVFVRFTFNRISALKLVEVLLKNTKICNKTITYYMQQLCLQVKAGQIQRACVHEVAQVYAKNTEVKSQILNKFIQNTSNLKYNLKFPDRNIKISQEQLLTQLQDEDDMCKKQYFIVSYKFILEKVLCRIVTYNFNDKLLWQQLLPNLMNTKQDQNVRQMSIKSERDNKKMTIMKQEHNLSNQLQEQLQKDNNEQKKQHVSVLEPDEVNRETVEPEELKHQ